MKTKLLFLVALVNFSLFSFAQNQNQNPNFTIGNAQAVEGSDLNFTIELNAPCNTDTTLLLSPIFETASALDFNGIQTTVTFPAGTTFITVSVPTVDDNISELTETMFLNASIVSGCNASANQVNVGIGTIIDIGELSIVTIVGTSVNEGMDIVFTTTLSNPSSTDVKITVLTVPGTAISSIDFVPITIPITITIPAGFLAGFTTVSVPTISDTLLEMDETFLLCGTVITNNTANTNPCGIGTIIENSNINASISLSISSTYNDFNNDGFTNVGDVINYQYTVTNTGQVPLTNAQVFYMQSSLPDGPIPTLAVGASDNTTYSYSYVLTQADINAGLIYTSAYVTAEYNGQQVANDFGLQTQLSISDGIKFNLFFDTNGNGVQDTGEQNYNGGVFTYQLNSGQLHSVTSYNGMFTLYENNPTNLYTIGCTLSSNNNYCNGQYSLSTSSYSNVSVTNGSGITTYNFPITTAPCTDLSVSLYNYGAQPRPGFLYSNVVYLKNYGNQTISSGTVTFTKDNAISITSTSPVTTATATGFTYNFTNLLPNEGRYINVYMQVPVIPIVALGQLVTNSVTTTIPSGDMNVANNAFTFTQTIVGSWDPNDKSESHGEKIVHSTFSSNEYLTYTIRFENAGTAEAINIRVNDVLDSQLDENSIRMVNTSHPYVLDKVGSTLNWKFDGVNLPPSVANTQIGHGYIVFQVKPKTGFAVGDIIPNTANIYFDFNPAIVTNTVTTEFVTTLAVNEFGTNSVSVYPNPVHANLNLTNSSKIDFVEVISVLGQKVLIQDVNDFDTKINMGSLEKGIYFVKVISEGKEKTIKIIKE